MGLDHDSPLLFYVIGLTSDRKKGSWGSLSLKKGRQSIVVILLHGKTH